MPHGLRLGWDRPSSDAIGVPAPAPCTASTHLVTLSPLVTGVAYGPISPAEAERIVAAAADGVLATEPALPWCAVVHGPQGLTAAASTQFSSGLFWRLNPLIVATDPRSATLPEPALDLDVVRALVAGTPEPERTVYAGVRRLPPGCLARWTAPDSAPAVTYAMDQWPEPTLRSEEAGEALMAALREACAVAARGGAPGLLLSGGLDSTMLASLLVERGPVQGLTYRPRPEATLWLADGAEADEGPLVDLLASALGPRLSRSDLVAPAQVRPLEVARQAFERAGVPVHNPANQWWIDEARRRALAAGSSLLLTGAHGNAAFSYDHPYAVAWALRRGRIGALLATARDDTGRLTAARVRRRILRPLSPRRIARDPEPFLVVPSRRGSGVHDRASYLAWLGRRLTGLPAAGNPAAVEGTLMADPFAAPAVLSAAAAIDPVEWRLGGRGRAVARRLAAGRVPDAIRLRTRRGQQGRDAWWLIRHDRDDYLDRVVTARNQPGFEGVEWAVVQERVAAWPWGTLEPPNWHEQVAVDRLLSLSEFADWAGSSSGRSLDGEPG